MVSLKQKNHPHVYVGVYINKYVREMKKYLNVRILAGFTMAIFMLVSITSCEKANPEEETPVLPPLESMQMDISDFEQEQGGSKGTLETSWNFLYSAVTVTLCNGWAVLVSALPIAAYGYALQQTPVYLGDYTWEWSYNFTWGLVEYTATLTGKREDNEKFSMEMVISPAANPEQGVKYFDGLVRYDHTRAEWTMYKQGTISVLEIGWNKDYETEEADLTYTFTEPGKDYTGSYIVAAYQPDVFFDAAYTISVPEGMINIEWNTTTLEGRVKAPAHFQDDAWHCWDTQANGLADKVCEQ